MNRYRTYGVKDDPPLRMGDTAFLGVDEYSDGENIKPGNVQQAVNHDFSSQDATTRGGLVCLPELGTIQFGQNWVFTAVGGAPSEELRGVAYGNGLFVIVTSLGGFYTSSDGTTWASGSLPHSLPSLAVAFSGGRFVAVGSGASASSVVLSDNGTTWSDPATPPTVGTDYLDVAYGNGRWIAVGSSKVAISTDNGNTWTVSTVAALSAVTAISFGNGVFCCTTYEKILTSNDGVTWSQVFTEASLNLTGVAYGNQRFVAIAQSGAIYQSSDTVTWTLSRAAAGTALWIGIAFGGGKFFAVDFAATDTPAVIWSINGTNWKYADGTPNLIWYDIAYGDGKMLAVGSVYTESTPTGALLLPNAESMVLGSSLYSEPDSPSSVWIMVVGYDRVGFYAQGRAPRSISLDPGEHVTGQSTIVQCNNVVYLFRGDDVTPLYWDGNWNGTFALAPASAPLPGFSDTPDGSQATYYVDRLWVREGKDTIAASDVLDFTRFDDISASFRLNTGSSDYIVATYPFGENTLLVFKNKSILALNNVQGSLSDVTATEVTRQVGLVGINAIVSVGPDLAYVSNDNVNLITLTSTNNAVQHKTLPLSAKIRKIMGRVNWDYGYKISLGYWNNKLYVALPLDNSIFCNAVAVYNFITENWYGEWTGASTVDLNIQSFQVLDYLGAQRLHAVMEDGRIFVTDEGQNDISGSLVAEINTQLVTRAYNFDGNSSTQSRMWADLGNSSTQRRMWADLGTNRPEFSVTTYTDGASESSTILTDQTYARDESWLFNDPAYDVTNVNNDFNRAYRKDYSSGPLAAGSTQGLPTTGLQCGTGFQPEMRQAYRFPIITRRQGRLSWLSITNASGVIDIKGVGFENHTGQLGSLLQV